MSKPYQIIVVELSDISERRNPSKPHLYVSRTQTSPHIRYEYFESAPKEKWYAGKVIQLREDLMDGKVYNNANDARVAMKTLVNQLSCQGFTVNRDSRIWSVYVIELDPAANQHQGIGYLYVGETCKEHSVRFQEHVSKKRNNRGRLYSSVVASYGIRLRPDLAPNSRIFCSQESKRAEAEWAAHLRNLGYTVEGGH